MTVKFVAEISSNHNQDIERCKEFIRVCKMIGCDAVKFQLFKIDELFAPEILAKREDLRARAKWELPLGYIPELAQYTHDLGLEFSCTPFYLEAVDALEPYVDFYKIASYELLWTALLEKCAKTNKPVVISTGMATLDEISEAVNVLVNAGAKDITVLHCTSAYPTPLDQANIRAIETLRKAIKPNKDGISLKFGLSDHTVSDAAVLLSIYRYNASFLEFHFDLDGQGFEFGPGHCWLPERIGKVIELARAYELVDGTGVKVPGEAELPDRMWRADPSDGLRPLIEIREKYTT
jgi:N-acetylneuraminate synthase